MADTRFVDEALVALVAAETEDELYGALVRAIHGLLPHSFVIASALVPDAEEFRIAATAGLEKVIKPASKIFGFDPLAITYSTKDMPPEDLTSFRTGRLEHFPGGLYVLALRRLPKTACAAVEHLTGVKSAYGIGFVWQGQQYGGISLGLRADPGPAEAETIEMLVRVATVAVRRHRAEALLREKTAELDSFFSETLDLLCIVDTEGSFRRLNPEWERALGYPVRELEGRQLLDFVHPDDIEATLAARARLAQGHVETTFAIRVRTKAGGYRWLEWRAFPRGALIYAAARDLTDRIEAERALRESETRYRFIADNTADVIWLMDVATGRFKYVSPSVTRLRGYTPEEVLAQPVSASLTPESFAWIGHELPLLIAAIEAGDEELRQVTAIVDQPCRDGSIVSTEAITTLLLNDEGKVMEALGVSRDITERLKAEAEIRALNEGLEARVRERTSQLEDAIAELESFSYSVSHDLRSPLRAINGYATILELDHGEAIGEDGRSLCDSIVAATRRMGHLIDDLLAFAHLGRVQLADEPVDMDALVAAVLEELDAEQRRPGVRLQVDALAGAHGDSALLRQVWVNLLDNALKFTAGAEEPRVQIGSRREAGETVYWVADNGAGFDMRYSDKLFQVFERLHAGEYHGSGIGLAIVRRAVEAHGGRVWAEGAPGAGATFSFALPATAGGQTVS